MLDLYDAVDKLACGGGVDIGEHLKFRAILGRSLGFWSWELTVVVATLHIHMGANQIDQVFRSILVEYDDMVNTAQRDKYFGAILDQQHRTPIPFEPAHTVIAVQTKNQNVTQTLCLGEVSDVTTVQQIETSVGENDSP